MRPRHTTSSRRAVLAFTTLLTMSLVVMPSWTISEARAEDDFDTDDFDKYDDPEVGERHYEEATRYTRFKAYTKALASFKKALPYMNEESDIYFSLVNVAFVLKKYEEVYFYGATFVRIEPEGSDSRAILLKMKKAGSTLKSKRRAPAEVRFRVRPKGTPLYVNDVPVGDSGGPPLMFPAGTYTVRGKIEGYHPFEQTFTVNPRTPMTVKGSFEKIKYYGHLNIQTFEAPCAWPCSALRAAVDQDDKTRLGLKVA